MNETLDDVQLRAEEAQMRHALGLDGETQMPRTQEQPPPSAPGQDRLSLHRPPRRFVKDGEVPVTVVRRTHAPEVAVGVAPATSNQLEAARQTIRSQAVATERAERALNEAQVMVRDLRTKLAHERMAKDEALQTLHRVESERDSAVAAVQAMRMELATERVGREKLEQQLRSAQEARQIAEGLSQRVPRPRGRPRKEIVALTDPLAPPRKRGRPRKVVVALAGLPAQPPTEGAALANPSPGPLPGPLPGPRKRGRPRKIVAQPMEPPAAPRKRGRPRKVPLAEPAALDLPTARVPGRVGRPPKVRESKPVKWWVKGWKAK